jgi:hypothetical protein
MHAGDKVLNEQEVRGGVQTVDLHAYGGGSAWSLLVLFVDGFHCDSMQHRILFPAMGFIVPHGQVLLQYIIFTSI